MNIETESLADAVDRLLDRLYQDHWVHVKQDLPLREAVELARRAYLRERAHRDELASDFPALEL